MNWLSSLLRAVDLQSTIYLFHHKSKSQRWANGAWAEPDEQCVHLNYDAYRWTKSPTKILHMCVDQNSMETETLFHKHRKSSGSGSRKAVTKMVRDYIEKLKNSKFFYRQHLLRFWWIVGALTFDFQKSPTHPSAGHHHNTVKYSALCEADPNFRYNF